MDCIEEGSSFEMKLICTPLQYRVGMFIASTLRESILD